MSRGWRFSPLDSTAFGEQNYNDKSWENILINKGWQLQGFPEHIGYGWYRKKVFLSSKFKDSAASDSIEINLGIINFNEQAFLNGVLLAENAKVSSLGYKGDSLFSRRPTGLFILRKYMISKNDPRIKWNSENQLAVRVFCNGDGGGIYGLPYIKPKTLYDELIFDKSKFYSIDDQKVMDTLMTLRNQSKKTVFMGDLNMSAIDLNSGKVILSLKKENIRLIPGGFLTLPVSIPVTVDSIKVVTNFLTKENGVSLSDTVNLPFVLLKNIN